MEFVLVILLIFFIVGFVCLPFFCVLSTILPVSLDCPLYIVPSVFSNKNVDIKISAHDAFLE